MPNDWQKNEFTAEMVTEDDNTDNMFGSDGNHRDRSASDDDLQVLG